MLSQSMRTQIEMDKSGNVWIKSIFLRLTARFTFPFNADKRKFWMENYWGFSGEE